MPNYTLAVDSGAYTFSGTAAALRAARKIAAAIAAFALSGASTGLTRTYTATAEDLVLRLKRLSNLKRIALPDGTPTFDFHRDWNQAMDAIEQAFTNVVAFVLSIQTAYNAAAQAHSAANAANNAAAAADALIVEIEEGTFEVEAINVGGTRFINSGGSLLPEP